MSAKAGAPSETTIWNCIDWKQVEASVRRLQTRIAQAVQQKHWNKVKALQWLLTHSFHAKLLAIKRVTSNKGKNCPGIDGVLWQTSRHKLRAAKSLRRHGYKPKPLRRIYIPKRDRNKKRPLSIPTMYDRAMQALHMFSLVPVAETLADPNSYGFRQYRCCADAVEYCQICLSNRYGAEWILEGDIKACFDRISHDWLLDNIPMDKEILQKFLQAGYMEQGKFFHSKNGTPQGGIISPVLANMALDGIEAAIRAAVPRRSKDGKCCIHVIRYADDFIITTRTREMLTEKVLPVLTEFLRERGLELSAEKTLITHIDKGFDFLGQNVRNYRVTPWGKLLIKPSKTSIKRIKEIIRQTLKQARGWPVKNVIKTLNKRIGGWARYHRYVVSGEVFSKLNNYLYKSLWRWLRRRHGNKSRKWLSRKYWSQGGTSSTFSVRAKEKKGQGEVHRVYRLITFSSIHVLRYIKVRSHANPFNPQDRAYFLARKAGNRIRFAYYPASFELTQ
jgi:RNA-directed DNA polymerase